MSALKLLTVANLCYQLYQSTLLYSPADAVTLFALQTNTGFIEFTGELSL